jgi:hypothetical protein
MLSRKIFCRDSATYYLLHPTKKSRLCYRMLNAGNHLHYLVNQIVDSICEQFASYRHLQLIKWILLRYMRDVSRGGKCVRNNLWVSQTLCFVVSISCTFFLPRRNRNRGRIFHAAPHLIRMFLARHYFIRFCYAMEWRMKDMLQLKGWRWYQIWW